MHGLDSKGPSCGYLVSDTAWRARLQEVLLWPRPQVYPCWLGRFLADTRVKLHVSRSQWFSGRETKRLLLRNNLFQGLPGLTGACCSRSGPLLLTSLQSKKTVLCSAQNAIDQRLAFSSQNPCRTWCFAKFVHHQPLLQSSARLWEVESTPNLQKRKLRAKRLYLFPEVEFRIPSLKVKTSIAFTSHFG